MRWLPPRETAGRDGLVAGAALAGGALLVALGTQPLAAPFAPARPAWLYLIPMAVASAALLLRRRAPLACLAVGTVALLGDAALGGSFATVLIFGQVLYEACVHGPRRTWWWLLRVSLGLIVVTVVAVLLASGSWRPAVWAAVVGVLVLLFPVVTGLSVRQYRDQAEAERERAEQTARLAELDRRQAVVAERRQMARDLHDVIANHLSAVSIHATAAQSARVADPMVAQALTVIRESAVRGLTELRRMIRLLRDPDQPGAEAMATARLAEAEELVAAVNRAGLPARLTVTGSPRALPVEVDRAAYRILQEALTNALKHGGDGPARAVVRYRTGAVAVTVDNPLPSGPASNGAAAPGAGAGLTGMRERVSLLRGRLEAGPAGNRWRVHAELPDPPGADLPGPPGADLPGPPGAAPAAEGSAA